MIRRLLIRRLSGASFFSLLVLLLSLATVPAQAEMTGWAEMTGDLLPIGSRS
jgi:hypothetical protein